MQIKIVNASVIVISYQQQQQRIQCLSHVNQPPIILGKVSVSSRNKRRSIDRSVVSCEQLEFYSIQSVSYTHLDVYKRQTYVYVQYA